jgi:DNA-binding response OmpR family regulator
VSAVRRILLVAPDQAIGLVLSEQLSQPDILEIATVETIEAAFERLAAETFDGILLDAALPDPSPWRVLRDGAVSQPILLLNPPDAPSDSAPIDPVHGVNAVIARPFRLTDLKLAIEALLQPSVPAEDLPLGRYRFQPTQKLLRDGDGGLIRLTEKETAILEYLIEAGDQPIPRESLLTQVWGYNPDVTTHTLETHIYRLRQKIEDDPSQAAILVTVPGGYRLVV